MILAEHECPEYGEKVEVLIISEKVYFIFVPGVGFYLHNSSMNLMDAL